MASKKIDLGLKIKSGAPAEEKAKKPDPKLPEAVGKKYDPVITPTILHFPNMTIDMRKMTVAQADAIFEARPGKYLKLKKESSSANKP